MSIKIAKLRFFALMFRLCELEKERRYKIDMEHLIRIESMIIKPQELFQEPVIYERQGSKFINKPKHNFKKR